MEKEEREGGWMMARVSAREMRGLILGAFEGGDAPRVGELLAAGATVSMMLKDERTALCRACGEERFGQKQLEMVKVLLAGGADPNESWQGKSALNWVTRGGGMARRDAARELIQAGARAGEERDALARRSAFAGWESTAMVLLEGGSAKEWAGAAEAARAGGFEALGAQLEAASVALDLGDATASARAPKKGPPSL